MVITDKEGIEKFIRQNIYVLQDEFQRVETGEKVIFHTGDTRNPAVRLDLTRHLGATTDNPLKRWNISKVVIDTKQYTPPTQAKKATPKGEKNPMEMGATLD